MSQTVPLLLHQRLKAKREQLMLSQTEAAGQIGVSRRIYQSWEMGEVTHPRPRFRRMIDAWLNS